MKKQMFYFIIAALMILASVKAGLAYPSPDHEYRFEGNAKDSIGTINFTEYGSVVYDSTDFINGSYSIDLERDDNDYLYTSSMDTSSNEFSVSVWVKIESIEATVCSTPSKDNFYSQNEAGSYGKIGLSVYNDSGTVKGCFIVGNGATFLKATGAIGNDIIGEWINLAGTTKNANVLALYKNGEQISNTSIATKGSDTGQAAIGANPNDAATNAYRTDAKMDNLRLWFSHKLTPDEVKSIYQAEVGSGGIPVHLTITAEDYHTGGAVTNFSINLSNSTDSFLEHTTSGTLQFSNVSNNTEYNATIISNHSGGYFNRTLTVMISSGTFLNFRIWQSEIYINATNKWGGDPILPFNVSVGGQFNTSNATGVALLLLNAGNHEIRGAAANKINATATAAATPLSVQHLTIEFYDGLLNVTAIRATTGTVITDFTINITQDSTGQSALHSTTTGSVGIGVENTTYTIYFTADDYASANATITINATPYNYTFQIYQVNSVYFHFYDQISLETIDNVQLDLLSDLFAANYSTTTGNISVELLTPSTYTARFWSSPSYGEHLYAFTLTNGTAQNISLYMLNTSQATEITATVIDESADAVVGAKLYVLRYNIVTNSYLTTEIVTTNLAGQATFLATQNSEFYKFMVYYGGEFKPIFPTFSLITAPSYIISTNVNIQVLLGETPLQTFFNVQDITHSLVYNEGTNNFRLTYADPNGLVSQCCVKLYRLGISGTDLINTTCLSSTAGTILVPVNVINGTTYRADAFVTIGGETRFLDSLLKRFFGENTLGVAGIFLVIFIAGIIAYAGRWDITIPLISVPIWIFIATGAGLINLPMEAAVALLVAGFLLAFIIAKKRSGS